MKQKMAIKHFKCAIKVLIIFINRNWVTTPIKRKHFYKLLTLIDEFFMGDW